MEALCTCRCRYYAVIEYKVNLWSRHDYFIHAKTLQMQGGYRDSACKIPEGSFYYFHANGKLSSTDGYVRTKNREYS